MSYLLERNIKECIEDPLDRQFTDDEREELKEEDAFLEGNVMRGMNGLQFGNLQNISVPAGERVRFYVLSLGPQSGMLFVHWKGHTVLHHGQRVAGVQLMPGVATVADMPPTEAGEWGMYSHTNSHHVQGRGSQCGQIHARQDPSALHPGRRGHLGPRPFKQDHVRHRPRHR